MTKQEFDVDKWIRTGFESMDNMLMLEHYLELIPLKVENKTWLIEGHIMEEDRLILEWNSGEVLSHFQYDRLARHFQVSLWLDSRIKDWKENSREDKPNNADSLCVLALNAILQRDRKPPEEKRLMIRDEPRSLVFASPDHVKLFHFLLKKFGTFSRNAFQWTKKDYETVLTYVESQQHLLGCCDLVRKGMCDSWQMIGKTWTSLENNYPKT